MMFFWNRHFDQDVPRGPFHSAHDWLAAHLVFVLNDTAAILDQPNTGNNDEEDEDEEEDDREEAEVTQALAERLVRLLPRIFPALPDNTPAEVTVIHHDGILFHNLLVDDNERLTGILDWECVSALPLWCACTLPSFLRGRPRTKRPEVEGYAKDEDGKPNQMYFEHLRDWEQSRLRDVFLDEMQHLQPEWVSMHWASRIKNDFYLAVRECDGPFSKGYVRR